MRERKLILLTNRETPLAGSSSYLHTTSFCLLPFKTHPMKKPHHFSLSRENITPMHVTETGGGGLLSVYDFKNIMNLGGAEKQKLTEEALRRMYIICVATYLYLRIVTFHMNRKIRRENNTYRRLSEDPASVPPNCHVSYKQETRRENNLQR